MNRNMANLGMRLEMLVEYACKQYEARGVAIIQKISTPWKVVRSGKQIISAFPEKKSTVDFIGLVNKGPDDAAYPVAFEAKSTDNTTKFPLKNIEQHQRDFLTNWTRMGGRSFYLIDFAKLNRVYYVPLGPMEAWIELHGPMGSVKIEEFETNFFVYPIISNRGIVLDFLGGFYE